MIEAMQRGVRFAAVVAAYAAGVSCAASAPAGDQVFLAPSDVTVVATLQDAPSGRGRDVYVENRSTVPVNVNRLELRNCQNVKNLCGVNTLQITISPGRRQRIFAVEPQNPDQGVSFSYSWGWEASARIPLP